MKVKRTIAGSIAALLLAVTSMAAACDLSCAFAMASSDCHASESTTASAGSADAMAGMDIGGMDLSEMAMPGASDRATPPSTSDMSTAKAAHPSIGDMGQCERQSCDKGSFVFVKAGCSGAGRMNSILPAAKNAGGVAAPRIFYGARDDGARFPSFKASPLSTILRI
jgi:hypothetical protein